MSLWPVVGGFLAWRDGDLRFSVLAMAALVLAGIPALGVWLGKSWGRTLAEYFCLAGMASALIHVLKNNFTLQIAPAAGYFVVYAFLSHERLKQTRSASAPAPRAAEHPLEWLRENIEAIAVAFIMALIIRCFCIEVFMIPSSSMEPTLRGAQNGAGDRIMVTKYYYALEPVSRWDVVVFKFPLNPLRNFIKRVVGLPEEQFFIYEGNIYARPLGSATAPFQIQRKPRRLQQSIWQDPWPISDLLRDMDTFQKAFTASSARDTRVYGGSMEAQGTTRFEAQAITDSSHTPVNEVIIEGELTILDGQGSFFADIRHDAGMFRMVLRSDGECALLHNGARKTPGFGPLTPGRRVRFEFMVYDGAAHVVLDNEVQAEHRFLDSFDQAKSLRSDHGLSFGSEGIRFELRRLRVGRDLYHRERPALSDDPPRHMSPHDPLEIPKGMYVMMGDNVGNSHDSRAWIKHTFVLRDGRTVICEGQDLKDMTKAKQRYEERTGRPAPDYVISADIHGWEQAFNEDDIAPNIPKEGKKEAFQFVDGKYLVGKALWVWWPPGRWFRLIR
ncbi:MAG: signal peptidase I [Planctomycetes bacterium]|nr:signal peptidase I [Planctomycetota bacterium]